MPANLENSTVITGLEKVSFHSNPKERQCQRMFKLSSVQSLSHVRLFPTPWTAARQASLSFTNSLSLLRLMFIESVMPSNHLILCRPLLFLPSQSFPASGSFQMSQLFALGSQMKYWSFIFINSPFNEQSGLISFRIDWFDS